MAKPTGEKAPMDAKKALSIVDKVLDDFDCAFNSEETEAVCQARDALAEKLPKGVCINESSENKPIH